jgi:hypothetical protein
MLSFAGWCVVGTTTSRVAMSCNSYRLYFWEIVTPRGFSNVATLCPLARCFTLISGRLIDRGGQTQ